MSDELARHRAPAWYDRAFFYHIYPLGMLGTSHDGLRRLGAVLPHLTDLGVTGLYLGPVFMSSTHGYDTTDYFNVDPRLGTNGDLAEFVRDCHDHGIRVILDGVFNHVGREFWGFREALAQGPGSIAWPWFKGLTADPSAPGGVRYETWEGHESLVKLDLENDDTRRHLFGAIRSWVENFDIDGLRLDAADCLTPDFIRALRIFCDGLKPEFYLMGEVIHGDYRIWANDAMFDGTTNYEAYKGIWSSHNDRNFFEIAYTLNRQFGPEGIYRGLSMYSFVENHDVNRLASTLSRETDLPTCYALMFLMPGIPSVYYTGEFGMRGRKTTGYDADLPVRPRISPEELACGHVPGSASAGLPGTIRTLARLRRDNSSLVTGAYRQLDAASEHLIFQRGSDTVCAVSMEESPQTVTVRTEPGRYTDMLDPNFTADAPGGALTFSLVPHWARVLKKI